jgi:NAD(P)-dependent dehydrogenase (short-subunit alcohol dehydrogenase family)
MIFEKTALVTGSGSRIAKSIIKKIEPSYLIFKHRLNSEENYLYGDLSNESYVISLFDSIKINLDLIVCCVGGIRLHNKIRPNLDDCININFNEAKELFDKNFFTTFLTCKYGIKKLKENSDIIVIGSAVVSRPRLNAEVGMYACSKAAVHEYVLHLAKQLEATNIRVNCIATDGHNLKKIQDCVEDILSKKTTGNIFTLL